ncbi:phosphoserine aminotransferase [Xylariomycetidae sp. FL2044]|nr:phosphoserine aminotransferase [Xylariomycetidae sp. FL2044]
MDFATVSNLERRTPVNKHPWIAPFITHCPLRDLALLNSNDTVLRSTVGIAEHSHRPQHAADIVNQAKADWVTHLNIPNDYDVLFIEGAVSAQFSTAAYNLVRAWVVIGCWFLKTYEEAGRLFGPEHPNLAADARKINDGNVEFPGFPSTVAPQSVGTGPKGMAGMSSNILSQRFPVQNFSVKNFLVVFFGAQNYLDSTGVTVVKRRASLLPSAFSLSAVIFIYETISKINSLYNTTSIFDVYHGVGSQKLLRTYSHKVNGQEGNDSEKAVADFLKQGTRTGLTGLKGHRIVGGIRASNYNCISLPEAENLSESFHELAKA